MTAESVNTKALNETNEVLLFFFKLSREDYSGLYKGSNLKRKVVFSNYLQKPLRPEDSLQGALQLTLCARWFAILCRHHSCCAPVFAWVAF